MIADIHFLFFLSFCLKVSQLCILRVFHGQKSMSATTLMRLEILRFSQLEYSFVYFCCCKDTKNAR